MSKLSLEELEVIRNKANSLYVWKNISDYKLYKKQIKEIDKDIKTVTVSEYINTNSLPDFFKMNPALITISLILTAIFIIIFLVTVNPTIGGLIFVPMAILLFLAVKFVIRVNKTLKVKEETLEALKYAYQRLTKEEGPAFKGTGGL